MKPHGCRCEGAWGWPQAKLWLRMAYTFLFFVMILAITLEVKLHELDIVAIVSLFNLMIHILCTLEQVIFGIIGIKER